MKTSQAELLLITLNQSFNDIKGKVGVRIARNKRMIAEELTEYFHFKQEILQKWKVDQNTKPTSDNYKKALEELTPLMNEEVSFHFRTFTDEDLEECGCNTAQADFLMQYFEEKEHDNTNL